MNSTHSVGKSWKNGTHQRVTVYLAFKMCANSVYCNSFLPYKLFRVDPCSVAFNWQLNRFTHRRTNNSPIFTMHQQTYRPPPSPLFEGWVKFRNRTDQHFFLLNLSIQNTQHATWMLPRIALYSGIDNEVYQLPNRQVWKFMREQKFL